ncbi:Ribosomal protein L7Ae [Evansella caseinilytica]|uniref:Ribosomal protein L7Ae n=1 Tax=Evansella caseinilytica TaxID=1503961 RepID=A0A1H3M3G1_9BACI|nr:YlxQ family RNA-binding protein [Evansella caseinilytica]SDY70555.1 Ribosomal protein L7Ae [Evansella caseinilytica]
MTGNQWLNTLGLIQRAGKLISGEELVTKAIQKKKVFFVLVSEDASENTKKKILNKCDYYNIPCAVKGDRSSIGRAVGKEERVVIGVGDAGFAKMMRSLIE